MNFYRINGLFSGASSGSNTEYHTENVELSSLSNNGQNLDLQDDLQLTPTRGLKCITKITEFTCHGKSSR